METFKERGVYAAWITTPFLLWVVFMGLFPNTYVVGLAYLLLGMLWGIYSLYRQFCLNYQNNVKPSKHMVLAFLLNSIFWIFAMPEILYIDYLERKEKETHED